MDVKIWVKMKSWFVEAPNQTSFWTGFHALAPTDGGDEDLEQDGEGCVSGEPSSTGS